MYEEPESVIYKKLQKYTRKADEFREHLNKQSTEILKMYKDFLEPKDFLDKLCFAFDIEKGIRYREILEVLAERKQESKVLN